MTSKTSGIKHAERPLYVGTEETSLLGSWDGHASMVGLGARRVCVIFSPLLLGVAPPETLWEQGP